MVKILIADDEVPIREWMAFCIHQMNLPCKIVGLAADGKQALELFYRHHPDLVFTDIKMPGLDGIGLVSQIRASGSKARVVFLTSHSNFDFARQALLLGAEAYILKTEIRAESIAQQISACHAESDTSFPLQVRRQSFVSALLNGGFPAAHQVEAELKKIGVDLENRPLAAIAVQLSQPLADDTPIPERLSTDGLFENLCCLSYKVDILLVAANMPQMSSACIENQALAQFADTIGDYFRAPVCVSSLHPDLEYLGKAFTECTHCLNLLFYDDWGSSRLFYSAVRTKDPREIRGETDRLIQLLDHRFPSALLEDLLDYLAAARSTDLELVKDCVARLLNAAVSREIKNTALFLEATQEIESTATEAEVFSQLRDRSRELMCRLEKGWRTEEGQPYSMHVRTAMEYVRSRYAQCASLTQAAEYVGVSGEYLSRLFRQEVGETFVGYLSAYRMDKAMELLNTTNLKIYEVAEHTGYANMSYFSRAFKKHFGCSPFQIRAGGKLSTTT